MNILKKLKNRWAYAKEQVYVKAVMKIAETQDGVYGDFQQAYMDYYMLTGDLRALIDALELRRPGRNRNPDNGASVYVNPIVFRKILIDCVFSKDELRASIVPLYRDFEYLETEKVKRNLQK